MKQHAEAAVPGPKKWIEVHCEENLRTFNKGVVALREKVEPMGCKVVSTLLLRNPLEQGISEWLYFFKDQVDGMRESQNPLSWTSDYLAWAKAHSEEELRLLTSPDSVTPVDSMIWDKDAASPKGTPLPSLLSCEAAVGMAKEEMAKIDVVATMDTPEEFAAFWSALGRKSGFEPLSEKAEELFNTHGETDNDPELKAEERELILKANECSLRITDMARAHMSSHADTTLINGVAIQDDVSKLLMKWGGAQRVAKALKERERPAGMMAKLAMSFSNSSMLKPKA
jgi:tryptophan 2,3-dioxygenase